MSIPALTVFYFIASMWAILCIAAIIVSVKLGVPLLGAPPPKVPPRPAIDMS